MKKESHSDFLLKIPSILPGEKWKDVPGQHGRYAASNLGRVFSFKKSWISGSSGGLHTRKARFLKPSKNRSGYLSVNIGDVSSPRMIRLNRLVADLFVEGDHSLEVNHIDGDKNNNSASNLEWDTHQYNMTHAEKNGLMCHGSKHRWAKLDEEKVAQIKRMIGLKKPHNIASIFSVHPQTIYSIIWGRSWKLVKI